MPHTFHWMHQRLPRSRTANRSAGTPVTSLPLKLSGGRRRESNPRIPWGVWKIAQEWTNSSKSSLHKYIPTFGLINATSALASLLPEPNLVPSQADEHNVGCVDSMARIKGWKWFSTVTLHQKLLWNVLEYANKSRWTELYARWGLAWGNQWWSWPPNARFVDANRVFAKVLCPWWINPGTHQLR